MLRVELQSRSIQAVTYQEQSASLEVEFRRGAIYRYRDVPAEVYQELLRAESHGRYFNQHIRDRFCYTKIDSTCASTTDSALHQETESPRG